MWWPWKKVPDPIKPEPGVWISQRRDDYAVGRLGAKITPAQLGESLRSADRGSTRALYEILEAVEQDPDVTAALTRRRRAVTRRLLQIRPADDSASAGAASDLCSEVLAGISGWDDALFDLTDGIGKAVAVSQIVWQLEAGRWVPGCLRRWPQRDLIFGSPDGMDSDEVRLSSDTDLLYGEALAPWQWICHRSRAWSAPLARAQLLRGVAWFYLFKRFSYGDWSIFLERYGLPLRIGRYHAGASDAEKQALWDAVSTLGRDAACIMSINSQIEVLETKLLSTGSGQLPHQAMIDHCASEISKAIWGNTMAISQGDRGARSAKEAFSADEEMVIDSDCAALAATVRRDLLTPIVRFNVGFDAPIPTVAFVHEASEDLLQLAQRDEILSRIGLRIGDEYFRTTYGIPAPEEGEEIVSGPRPAAALEPPLPATSLADNEKKNSG